MAEGCQFTDGSVALRWRGDNPATAVWPNVESVLAVHGHQGATEVRWIEPADAPAGDVLHDVRPGAPSSRPARSTEPPEPLAGLDNLFDELHQVRGPSSLSEPLSPPPGHSRGWAGARHLR
ncbi:hypothetical protein GCM10009804_44660 [Kribbella hippodromi]|uniref:Uncharacterized protein n=1 Tax=Kribbella hippodromi TaxID=434347 RepID=A0ABN2DSI4_9ACTN